MSKKKTSGIKFKEINIPLAGEWKLHVWVSKDRKQLRDAFINYYGVYDNDHNYPLDACYTIDSGSKSLMKGHTVIVMTLQNEKDLPVLVRELIHALWHISKNVGFDMCYESQEWQACMFEELFLKVRDKNWIDSP